MNEWRRPDGELTRKRGSAEILPNGNIFAAWSDFGYMSEHTRDNELVLEARFLSPRYATYRAFKADFIGIPKEPPAIKTFVVVSQNGSNYHMTTSFVSWNGATEVASWRFFGWQDTTRSFVIIGTTPKIGFETVFSQKGAWRLLYVEAIATNGTTIGRSNTRSPRFLSGSLAEFEATHSASYSIFPAADSPEAATRVTKPTLPPKVEEKLRKATAALTTVGVFLALESAVITLYFVVRFAPRRHRVTIFGCERKRRHRSESRELCTTTEDRVQLLSRGERSDN